MQYWIIRIHKLLQDKEQILDNINPKLRRFKIKALITLNATKRKQFSKNASNVFEEWSKYKDVQEYTNKNLNELLQLLTKE